MLSSFVSMGILDLAAFTTTLAMLWLVHSTLVIGVGLLAGRLLRGRGPALQCAVYRVTLAATLACPVAAAVWAQAGLSFAGLQLPSFAKIPSTQPLADAAGGHLPGAELAQKSLATRPSVEASQGMPSSNPLEVRAAGTGDEDLEWSISGAAVMTAAVSLCWLFGSTLLLARLISAHWQVIRVRRATVPSAADDQRLCRELSGRIGVAPPMLLRTPFVAGPCLAGIVRPVVLLPEVLSVPVPRSVLIHELAHLSRNDCTWNLAGNVTVAVLFFQPLIWRLARLLETTAEEACDDFVIEHGADRKAYADLLVELAKSSVVAASVAVVPLITLRSQLARRVVRIMDRSRRLQLAVSSRASCAILALGLAVTFAAAATASARRDGSALEDHESPVVPSDLDPQRRPPQDQNGPSTGFTVETVDPGGPRSQPARDVDYKVGDRIVVIHQRVPIVVDDKTVDQAFMGWIFTVDHIDGSKLWVPAKTPGWIETRDTVPYPSGLAYFDDFLKRNPTDKQALRAKAMLLMDDGDSDAAIVVFTEMLRLDPKDHTVWNDVGRAWLRKREYDRAIVNFNEAIRIHPFVSVYFHNRGEAWHGKCDAANAIKDWKSALTVRPKFQWSQRALGWLLATWPDERFRNGTEAVKRATIACELSAWLDATSLETLAAAYAESGDFVQAIEWQTKAHEMIQPDDARGETAARLELYKQGRPYRDDGHSVHARAMP